MAKPIHRKKKTPPSIDEIAPLLEEISQLMRLNAENPFKSKAFERGAEILGNQPNIKDVIEKNQLTQINGIGAGIAEVVQEYYKTGESSLRESLKASLPEGLLELTKISGLGPAKARTLIDELKIRTIAELEYACRENRLTDLRGFGAKAQAKILEQIQFINSTQGQIRLVDADSIAKKIHDALDLGNVKKYPVNFVGDYRRRMETVSAISILVGTKEASVRNKYAKLLEEFLKSNKISIPVTIHFTDSKHFGVELLKRTGSDSFIKPLLKKLPKEAESEAAVFRCLEIPEISPEQRESPTPLSKMKLTGEHLYITEKDIKGVFHNHTKYSDGTATAEEMIIAAIKHGYDYIGISDHSQSAFYAQGLKNQDLIRQRRELAKLQKKYPKIRILWGIESDILRDGQLDYSPDVLNDFDFVIASVHSRFGLDRSEMTKRIIAAIKNPYCQILGHPTGRLLLGRKEYEMDMEEVIRIAAKNAVALEINANPARLDLDWRWGPTLIAQKAWVAISPDAHSVDGLEDTPFGITVARKAMIPKTRILNTLSSEEVTKWLKQKKVRRK